MLENVSQVAKASKQYQHQSLNAPRPLIKPFSKKNKTCWFHKTKIEKVHYNEQ
jgi:hypothetical protein